MPLDFSELKDMELLVETLQAFVKRQIPVRFGIVPVVNSPEKAQQAKIVHHIFDTYGLGAMFLYLSEVSCHWREHTPLTIAC
jgi:UDP-glucose:glycoprotein glucosyltransferase